MKIVFLLIGCIAYLFSNDDLNQSSTQVNTIEGAVVTFKESVNKYSNNVYLFQDEKDIYHVEYDPKSPREREFSFLQIYASKTFEDTLTQYRQIDNKKDLYIKKFNSLYFVRLSSKDNEHTRNMYIALKEKFPDIYYSRAIKPEEKKPDLVQATNKKHKIVFLENKQEKVKTDILKNIVFSISKNDRVPLGNTRKIVREGNLEKIYDLRDSVTNFAIVRGDILGANNAGLYGFEVFNNYGLLCSTTDEILYLVSREKVSSIYDLRRKHISVGNISNIAQVYLKDIANNSGIILDINFKSFSFDQSMKKLKNGELDAFFMFAPKRSVLSIVKQGFYISSLPDSFTKVLNEKPGLKPVKFKIDGRTVRSYKIPNFVVGVVNTLDKEFPKKIKEVVTAYSCYKNPRIPDPFYGNVHPELQNAIASVMADEKAKQLLEEQKAAISIKLYDVKKDVNVKTYYYQITNNSAEDVNLTYEMAKTKALDDYAFKPRHLLKMQLSKPFIEVKANSNKLISFKYSNPFATRLDAIELELNFEKVGLIKQKYSVPMIVGDK